MRVVVVEVKEAVTVADLKDYTLTQQKNSSLLRIPGY
jgi:hypothetical protein